MYNIIIHISCLVGINFRIELTFIGKHIKGTTNGFIPYGGMNVLLSMH